MIDHDVDDLDPVFSVVIQILSVRELRRTDAAGQTCHVRKSRVIHTPPRQDDVDRVDLSSSKDLDYVLM